MLKMNTVKSFSRMFCMIAILLLLSSCGAVTMSTSQFRVSSVLQPMISKLNLNSYTGDGYSIGYPVNWQRTQVPVDRMFGGSPVFQNNNASLLVYGTIDVFPSSQIVNDYINNSVNFSGYKKVTVPPTTTVNGVLWSQGALVKPNPQTGKTDKLMIFVAQNPDSAAKFKHFEIICQAPVENFDTINQTDFQPMLQSFRFLS